MICSEIVQISISSNLICVLNWLNEIIYSKFSAEDGTIIKLESPLQGDILRFVLDCHLWCERMLITENHKFTLFLVIGFVLLGLVFCIVIWELLFVFIFLLLGFHFVFVFSILSLSFRNSVLVSMSTDNCLFDNFTKSREYIYY